MEIVEYLKINGFPTAHIIDTWQEGNAFFCLTGINDIPQTQAMLEVEPSAKRYRRKDMRPGSVWSEWSWMV